MPQGLVKVALAPEIAKTIAALVSRVPDGAIPKGTTHELESLRGQTADSILSFVGFG